MKMFSKAQSYKNDIKATCCSTLDSEITSVCLCVCVCTYVFALIKNLNSLSHVY